MHINNTITSKGFTLIEVLITVLILSIGLLGLAGLQVRSMKSNHSAYLKSQATIMAYDMIDRMRANPNAVTNSDYIATGAYTVDPPGSATNLTSYYTVSGPAAVANCKTTSGCTTTQMANTDINEWRIELATLLPGGVGIICLDDAVDPDTDQGDLADQKCSGTGNIYAIKIWWNDERDAAGTLKRFVTSYTP